MFKTKVTPSFGDIDGMKHVNNNRILEWFELGGLDIYRYFTPDLDLDFENWKLIMVRKEADFVGQLRFGEDVEIRTYLLKIGNSSFTVGNEVWQSNELKAKGKTVIVHFDYVTQKSVPIPDDVRKKLEEHLISEEEIGKGFRGFSGRLIVADGFRMVLHARDLQKRGSSGRGFRPGPSAVNGHKHGSFLVVVRLDDILVKCC